MRKPKKVTRTVTVRRVTACVINKETQSTMLINVEVPSNYIEEKDIIKKINSGLDECEQVAFIKTVTDVTSMYEMTEDVFVANATKVEKKEEV